MESENIQAKFARFEAELKEYKVRKDICSWWTGCEFDCQNGSLLVTHFFSYVPCLYK